MVNNVGQIQDSMLATNLSDGRAHNVLLRCERYDPEGEKA
jgi:hypothetical protein